MEADRILMHLRPLILVVDGLGRMLDVRGGAGDLFGYRPSEMVGRNVLEFVAPSERASVATYFVEASGDRLRTVPMPMPFRTVVLDSDGVEHDVDVVPAGCADDDGEITGWVVTLMPLALQSSPSRSLNAELSGRPRSEVRQRLTEELDFPSDVGTMFWFHVDVSCPSRVEVTGPRHDPGIGPLLQRAVDDGWAPWNLPADLTRQRPLGRVLVGTGMPAVDLPPRVHDALALIDGNLLSWIPVDLDGATVGGYLELGKLPAIDEDAVKTNTLARVTSLIEVTRMLASRWRDQDRLLLAATRDSLTGLANRDSFHDALAEADHPVAVLYIDVDRFKEVNDRWGHAVGDRVLAQLAERIERSCRPRDVVARFGGDEFVVLLRDVDQAGAERIGERIVAAAGAPLELPDGPERVTLSIGLAPVCSDTDPVDVADRAMMSAKRLGRDRLVTA
jgi:diguanylate cyclase (GGDEF)-like protein/PAS domain S-box-containing protein